ncbi:photosystem II reaction center PSB28 protein, chloroplastic isoform X2 [Amborella trichopoda]|uniref:photosystem II reaction center PSB28 protein, chloroplastic isoform X2 n=1 Tax=Amborella trichopoda TaxID=13333 RepID=UPI0005D45374|nr:photosystem II reaction center PSB28 protein, chloroplastic isoform X2 [Amborella trichopoda]|eukprot:XP_011627041.1 photosystem II reaction center PSB28 protein, chloroplastic isoform X2 [Amborella trichopoda]
MAATPSHRFSSRISNASRQPTQRSLLQRSISRLISMQYGSGVTHSSFSGRILEPFPSPPLQWVLKGRDQSQRKHGLAVKMMAKPSIQFIKGTDEQTIPDVKLTKSRDGTNGVATFIFEEPSVFDSSSELGDITGFYMIDEEGVLQSADVIAKFINGKPAKVEAKYIMRSSKEWDRFMRFMERYSNHNGLQFIKK